MLLPGANHSAAKTRIQTGLVEKVNKLYSPIEKQNPHHFPEPAGKNEQKTIPKDRELVAL